MWVEQEGALNAAAKELVVRWSFCSQARNDINSTQWQKKLQFDENIAERASYSVKVPGVLAAYLRGPWASVAEKQGRPEIV